MAPSFAPSFGWRRLVLSEASSAAGRGQPRPDEAFIGGRMAGAGHVGGAADARARAQAIWIVEFYSDHCPFCKSLAPELIKAARASKCVPL